MFWWFPFFFFPASLGGLYPQFMAYVLSTHDTDISTRWCPSQ
jgi:hypothetical protein